MGIFCCLCTGRWMEGEEGSTRGRVLIAAGDGRRILQEEAWNRIFTKSYSWSNSGRGEIYWDTGFVRVLAYDVTLAMKTGSQ